MKEKNITLKVPEDIHNIIINVLELINTLSRILKMCIISAHSIIKYPK